MRKISPENLLVTQESKEVRLASITLGQSEAYRAATSLVKSFIDLLLKGQKHKKYCSNCHSWML